MRVVELSVQPVSQDFFKDAEVVFNHLLILLETEHFKQPINRTTLNKIKIICT